MDELYVSPSGSLLDPVEVPDDARRGIFGLVKKFPVPKFSFETRPETVTSASIDELVELLREKQLAVGLGLESADPWVLRHCVNKLSSLEAFSDAVAVLKSRGVGVYANVSLGSAFLSAREAIEDATRTVEWALQEGADVALVFPMHVKPHTLLAWLHARGEYRPPSLWSLIRVLQSVDRRHRSQVGISWYRADYGADLEIVSSPTTCRECETEVMHALDRYRSDPSTHALGQFSMLGCPCRMKWLKDLESSPVHGLPARVFSYYEWMSKELELEQWWEINSGAVRRALYGRDPWNVE